MIYFSSNWGKLNRAPESPGRYHAGRELGRLVDMEHKNIT